MLCFCYGVVFYFSANRHDVVKVPKATYDSCSDDNLNIISTAPTFVTLNETGIHYFICSVGDHCEEGQKMAVTVLDSSASSPNSQPPPPNSDSPRVLAGFFFIMSSFALGKLVL